MTPPVAATSHVATDVPRLRVLTDADLAVAAKLLGRSLEQDPGSTAFVADPAHRRRFNELGARRVIQAALPYATVHGAETGGALAGVAVWHPPAARTGSLSGTLQYYRDLARDLPMLPPVLARVGSILGTEPRAVLQLLREHADGIRRASVGPTWHLAALATDPAHRGRGIARLLLEHVLQRCDADGLAAWLETTNPTNPPIYHRFGFETVCRTNSTGTLPTWWIMRRPATSP